MDICQHRFSYIRHRAGLAALGLALLAGCTGCLHLREPASAWPLETALAPRPAPPRGGRGHLALTLLAAVMTLTALGWGIARRRRLRREAGLAGQPGRAAALDREDLALIRTARDALAFLVRKQLARFRVISLADFRLRDPPG
ncbi:MAG: hypothetical protein V1797_03920 [Pseudomonadota bacterium]